MNNSYNLLFALVPALIPIITNYILKLLENRNVSNKITRELDINQKRIEFVKNYYAVQKEFLSEEKVALLKSEVAVQLSTIKKETDDVLTDSYWHSNANRLSTIQKLFLTFAPASISGWVWRILYYLIFIFLSLSLLGYALNENSEFTSQAFFENLQDSSISIGLFFFVCVMLIFRQLALWSYEESVKQKQIISTQ